MSTKNKTEMARTEHIERHKMLHAMLDELIADWLRHQPIPQIRTQPGMHPLLLPKLKLPSNTTILELMMWSHRQTIEPEGDS